MEYLALCLFFGVAGGIIGRIKGSSFLLWFLISAVVPFGIGVLVALLYRFERDELRRECPSCGRICMLYDAVCTRCGLDLEFPDVAIAPESQATGPRPSFPANS